MKSWIFSFFVKFIIYLFIIYFCDRNLSGTVDFSGRCILAWISRGILTLSSKILIKFINLEYKNKYLPSEEMITYILFPIIWRRYFIKISKNQLNQKSILLNKYNIIKINFIKIIQIHDFKYIFKNEFFLISIFHLENYSVTRIHYTYRKIICLLSSSLIST